MIADLLIPRTRFSGECATDWVDSSEKDLPEEDRPQSLKRSNHCEFDVAVTDIPDFLKARVFYWVSTNPGVDAEAVAQQFRISPVDASDLVEELLNEGLLDFDE